MRVTLSLLISLGLSAGDPCSAQPTVSAPVPPSAPLFERLIGAWLTHAAQPSADPLLEIQARGGAFKVGPQKGWITAPLHTRTVLEALLAQVGAPSPEVAHSLSLSPLGAHLGVALFDHRSSPKTSGFFPHLSLEAARWISRQLEVEGQAALGVPLRRLAVALYGQQLTQLAVARVWLRDQARLDFERAAYELAMQDTYFQGPAYLKLRFGEVQTGYATPRSPDYVAFGFWLRREIDGSGPTLWRALKRLLPLIDPALPARLKALQTVAPPRPTFDGPVSLQDLTLFYERLLKSLSAPAAQGVSSSALRLLKMGLALTALPSVSTRGSGEAQGWRALQRALPYPLFTPRQEGEQGQRPFRYYNPRFIQWATEQLLPPAELIISGEPASAHYRRHLKLTIDSLIDAHLILYRSPERLKQERFELMMSLMSEVDPRERLRRVFHAELSSRQVSATVKLEDSLAFWLRREVDGSAPVLWGAAQLIIKRFDPARSQELEAALR